MRTLALLALLALTGPASAAPPRLVMGLADAEKAALAHSPALKAAESSLASAQDLVEVQLSQLVPRATLDGFYQYQTEVPKIALAPGAPPVQFTDHRGYSIGPGVTYTLFDDGSLVKAWRSQKALAASQDAQRALVRRQVRLLARLDYFQVQLALEQERSLTDSLRLALAQYRDISARFHAGAISRIDWLSAHEQVLARRRGLRTAQAELSAALRALFAVTGAGQGQDVSVPLDGRIEAPLPVELSSPTVVVELQPLEDALALLAPAAAATLDESYPQLLVQERAARAQELSAESALAGLWPKISLSYHGAYAYPEQPILRSYWQNTTGASMSVPVFEFGRARSQARAFKELADAALHQRRQAYDDLQRDWGKARDQYAALRDEEALDRDAAAENEEIARLRYASYRDGGSTILDVETSNDSAVQSRVLLARTRTQLLIQLATLASYSSQAEP